MDDYGKGGGGYGDDYGGGGYGGDDYGGGGGEFIYTIEILFTAFFHALFFFSLLHVSSNRHESHFSGEDTTPSFKMIDDIDGVAKVRIYNYGMGLCPHK